MNQANLVTNQKHLKLQVIGGSPNTHRVLGAHNQKHQVLKHGSAHSLANADKITQLVRNYGAEAHFDTQRASVKRGNTGQNTQRNHSNPMSSEIRDIRSKASNFHLLSSNSSQSKLERPDYEAIDSLLNRNIQVVPQGHSNEQPSQRAQAVKNKQRIKQKLIEAKDNLRHYINQPGPGPEQAQRQSAQTSRGAD